MPTKKTTKPEKGVNLTSSKKTTTPKGDLKSLRAELFSLKMKHSLRELKEVHKLRAARKAVARHLTQLNKSK